MEVNPFGTGDKENQQRINDLVNLCHGTSVNAGWWVDESGNDMRTHRFWFSNKLVLVHSELSESLEGDRKGKPDSHLPHRSARQVELADAFIRLLDLAGAIDEPDFGGAVTEKLAYNKVRADHQPGARMADGGKKY